MSASSNCAVRTMPDDQSNRLTLSVNYVGGSPSRIIYDYGDIFSNGRLISHTQPLDTMWHHYVFSRKNSSGYKAIYIDGELFISGTSTEVISNKNLNLVIGGAINGTSLLPEFFHGYIDDVRIFDYAIDTSIVGQLYRNEFICSSVSIQDFFDNSTFDYTVNYNMDTKQFTINNDIDNPLQLEIYSANGQLVEKANNISLTYIHTILQPGTYIGVFSNNEKRYSTRFIVP